MQASAKILEEYQKKDMDAKAIENDAKEAQSEEKSVTENALIQEASSEEKNAVPEPPSVFSFDSVLAKKSK